MKYTCAYCGKPYEAEFTLGEQCICEECEQKFGAHDSDEPTSPMQIKEHLDSYVVGQEEAKKVLSVAAFNHYLRIKSNNSCKPRKSNVLLIGPSGSGKTYLAHTLAKILSVPFAEIDAQTLTNSGYTGDDVCCIFNQLFECSEPDTEDIMRAQKGIIFIDEFDKLCQSDIGTNQRGYSRGVMQEFLKVIEGTKVSIPVVGGSKKATSETVMFDTSNVLFIFAGAFNGLENIIEKRVNKGKGGMGFSQQEKAEYKKIDYAKELITEDLINFGVVAEFLGRVQNQVMLHSLSINDMAKILSEPKDCILNSYKNHFHKFQADLCFTRDAISEIARQASTNTIGARGLQQILDNVLLDASFKAPSLKGRKQIIVSKSCIVDKKTPQIKLLSCNPRHIHGKPFVLFHKDKAVLEFEMDANFEICRVNDVLLETHLPPSVCKDNLFDSFKIWWDRRGIPQDRYRFDEVTQRLGSYSLNSLKVASNGMNLTDHYAISSDPNFKYSKSNFFEHEFSQDSGKLLFLEDSLDSMGSVSSLDLVSPNWCTNGRSQKRWVRKDGSLFLQKGLKEFDSDVNTLANQMIVSEICDELWVNYLPYTLNGNYIQCPNMCNIDDEFISAYDLLQSFDRYEGENSFSWIVRFGSQNGIDDSYYTVSEMRLVDKVTTRSSRTLFDFGFLRNADSLGNLRFAPMFDSGECHYAEAYGYTSVIDGNDHNLRCIMKSKEENQKVSLDLYEEVFLDMTKTLSIVDNEFDEKKMQRIFNSVWQELETA